MSDPKHINTGVPMQDEVSDIANNGGPAFPVTNWASSGMTLRDYFAATALQSLISSAFSIGTKTGYDVRKPDIFECLALDAYAHADAMLRAREAKP